MSECINEDVGRLLHAYELGQLDENDCERFEEHLMECDYCFEQAKKSQSISRMILTDNENRKNIEELVSRFDQIDKIDEHEDNLPRKEVEKKLQTSRVSKIIRITVSIAAVLVILLLKPWDITFHSTNEALAYENLLAILYFEDMTDGESGRLGEIASDLLINDLAESEFVTVVSSQRIFDILKLTGNEGIKKVSRDMATEVAGKAHARWMLTGSILQEKPSIILTSQLVDVQTGVIIASQKVSGTEDDDVFSMVDRLTVEIKKDLSLPSGAMEEYDPKVKSITTSSMEAYGFYLEGMDYYYKYLYKEAAESFKQAIVIDTTFALAYYRLYLAGSEPSKHIALAMKYLSLIHI